MGEPRDGSQDLRYRDLSRRQRPHARYLNRGNARILRAILQRPGNAGSHRTAWWAREDSNLQPDRYERSALTIELRARRSVGSKTAPQRTATAHPHTMLRCERQLRLPPLRYDLACVPRIGRTRPKGMPGEAPRQHGAAARSKIDSSAAPSTHDRFKTESFWIRLLRGLP